MGVGADREGVWVYMGVVEGSVVGGVWAGGGGMYGVMREDRMLCGMTRDVAGGFWVMWVGVRVVMGVWVCVRVWGAAVTKMGGVLDAQRRLEQQELTGVLLREEDETFSATQHHFGSQTNPNPSLHCTHHYLNTGLNHNEL